MNDEQVARLTAGALKNFSRNLKARGGILVADYPYSISVDRHIDAGQTGTVAAEDLDQAFELVFSVAAFAGVVGQIRPGDIVYVRVLDSSVEFSRLVERRLRAVAAGRVAVLIPICDRCGGDHFLSDCQVPAEWPAPRLGSDWRLLA